MFPVNVSMLAYVKTKFASYDEKMFLNKFRNKVSYFANMYLNVASMIIKHFLVTNVLRLVRTYCKQYFKICAS